MSDTKHRQAVHRTANVRRDAWDRRVRIEQQIKPPMVSDVSELGTGPEGESRVVRRTAAWDVPEQAIPPEYFGMRLKGNGRPMSSPTLPGFPLVLHERASQASSTDVVFRLRDGDGRERLVSELGRSPRERDGQSAGAPNHGAAKVTVGPSVISYATLVATIHDVDWEMGFLATIALCRMLVKERFHGQLDPTAVGLDPTGKVVWIKDVSGDNGDGPAPSSKGGEARELVQTLATTFYRFVTGMEPASEHPRLASEVNVIVPTWVDTVCEAVLSEQRCTTVAEFLDLLHQHLGDEQREQFTIRLSEWALRTRRLSQPTEDAVAVQLGVALAHLGVAAHQTRRRRFWLPVSLGAVVVLLGVAFVAFRTVYGAS